MLKSYEAIYEDGQVKWLDPPPLIASARIIITVLAEVPGVTSEPSVLAASQLANLGGSQPDLQPIPRRRDRDF